MDEANFIRLHYCFAAGYTMPQFCIDNNIAKPLFVLKRGDEEFLHELYAQFHCDKRMSAQFCFIDADQPVKITFKERVLGTNINVNRLDEIKLNNFDKIIFLTEEMPSVSNEKFVALADLTEYFVAQAYVDIPLLNFLQRYPDVKIILTTNFPRIEQYENSERFLSKLWNEEKLRRILNVHKGKTVKTPLDKFGYTNAQVAELVKIDKSKRNLDGTTALLDDNSPLKQIMNGKRATAYQPEKYLNKIYFFGPCHYFGRNAPFDKTIESYLQLMLNEHNLPYRVENEGQAFSERSQDMFYNLNALNPAPGDIVFFHIWRMRSNHANIPLIDMFDVFDPPHDFREIFCTRRHVNELGYKILAEKFFNFLTANNFFRDKEINYPLPPALYFHRYGIPPQYERNGVKAFFNEELEAYKQKLRAKKLPVGAIVMNCNPFTLGHRYLVEYAAAKVAKLYIFVVEEDKSEFPFADRIKLVRQGVEDLPNVEVLPSGKFIISQTTFSGYFSKAKLQDVTVDSSEDVEIFGQEIAPTLGITIRFAGEEPKDNVTRQYNETMKRILPRYGVEFCEIPRKTFGDEVISASSVREALKRGDFDKIKNLVPETTLLYLRGRYSAIK